MNVLVVAEHNNNELLPATLHTVNAAKQIGQTDLLVVGNNCQDVTKSGAKIEGVKQEDIPFEERHQDIDRAKKIAFSQSARDRKHRNQALIASESSFHGNFATGILCLKASTLIAAV